MPDALIALGSNLGDREAIFAQAEARLARLPETRALARSRSYETAPVGGPAGQGPFLNAAVRLQTSLAPEALLESLRHIEAALGRRRAEHWGPRPIDLDLLLYGPLVLDTPTLVLPHPRMAWRRFVLEPAAEIAPSLVHPTIGWTISQLLEHLNRATPYVAIAGLACAGKTWLAGELTRQGGACLLAGPAADPAAGVGRANPSGSDWPAELQSLEEWTRLLAADMPRWSEPGRLWVTDFWFDQLMAVARAWFPDDRVEAFRRRWEVAQREVVQPKLLVFLDPPVGALWERIRRRGRLEYPPGGAELLERTSHEIRAEVMRPGRGPWLRLTGVDRRTVLDEVSAAIEAMK